MIDINVPRVGTGRSVFGTARNLKVAEEVND
jgi:hypothetical protein